MKKKLPLLVLGDIHNRWAFAERVLHGLHGRYRAAIMIGDYFDRFFDTPADVGATARWLAQSLAQPDRIHLLGNHDMAYMYSTNTYLLCPGFSWEKHAAVAHELAGAPCDRLKLAHVEDGWLFSHAGFAPEHADGETAESLVHRANALLPTLHEDRYHSLLACGAGRGGRSITGGVTWLDWWSEFTPIPGLNQIVGHTPDHFAKAQILRRGDDQASIPKAVLPRVYRYPSGKNPPHVSINWCLDCGLRQVALVAPRRVEIMDTTFLRGEPPRDQHNH